MSLSMLAAAEGFLEAVNALSVVDASALHTCSLLPEELRETVLASHEHLLVTTESLHDLSAARDSVTVTSGQLSLDQAGNPTISDQDSTTLGHRAQLMLDLAHRGELIPSTKPPEISDKDAGRFQPWFFLAPTAREHQAYLWCDDAALRRHAPAWGVATFGTLELVEALVARSMLTRAQRDEIHLALVAQRTFDMDLTVELLAVQAARDAWGPGAVTAAMARPASWLNARILLELLDEATRRNVASPDKMDAWLYSAVIGSCRMIEDPAEIGDMAKVLLVRAILSAGLAPAMTPPLVRGVRVAVQELSAPDPLPAALKELNETLLTRYEPSAAAQLLINTTVGLDTADRQAAVRAILGIS